MIWVEIVKDRRWERSDGAVVRYDDRTPNSNPAKDSARMFTAWEPGDNNYGYLAMHRGRERRLMNGSVGRPGFPRRWKNPKTGSKGDEETAGSQHSTPQVVPDRHEAEASSTGVQ